MVPQDAPQLQLAAAAAEAPVFAPGGLPAVSVPAQRVVCGAACTSCLLRLLRRRLLFGRLHSYVPQRHCRGGPGVQTLEEPGHAVARKSGATKTTRKAVVQVGQAEAHVQPGPAQRR